MESASASYLSVTPPEWLACVRHLTAQCLGMHCGKADLMYPSWVVSALQGQRAHEASAHASTQSTLVYSFRCLVAHGCFHLMRWPLFTDKIPFDRQANKCQHQLEVAGQGRIRSGQCKEGSG